MKHPISCELGCFTFHQLAYPSRLVSGRLRKDEGWASCVMPFLFFSVCSVSLWFSALSRLVPRDDDAFVAAQVERRGGRAVVVIEMRVQQHAACARHVE